MQIDRFFRQLSRTLTVGATVFLMASPARPAMAECHIAQADAQLCQSGIAAAAAYERTQALKAASNTAEDADRLANLLQHSGCEVAGVSSLEAAINVIARGPVTFEGAAIEVVSIQVNRNAYWYIAAGSLRGRCAVAPR